LGYLNLSLLIQGKKNSVAESTLTYLPRIQNSLQSESYAREQTYLERSVIESYENDQTLLNPYIVRYVYFSNNAVCGRGR
jgi:hypothetical protein